MNPASSVSTLSVKPLRLALVSIGAKLKQTSILSECPVNTGANTTKKLHIIQLGCGHFQQYRGITAVPAMGDRVECLQCPMVQDKPQRMTVRSSPKEQHPLDARCFGCSWRRRSSTNPLKTKTSAGKHSSSHSHLVIIYQLGKEVRRYDNRQSELNFETPPF